MLKVVKDVKGSMEAKDYNDAMGDFWQEVENLTVFEEKKEKISYATNCFVRYSWMLLVAIYELF